MPPDKRDSILSRLSLALGGPGLGVDRNRNGNTPVVPGVSKQPGGFELPDEPVAFGPEGGGWHGLPYEFDLGAAALDNTPIPLIGNFLTVIVQLGIASMDDIGLHLSFGNTGSSPFRIPSASIVFRTRAGKIWRPGTVYVTANLVAGVTLHIWDTEGFFPTVSDPGLSGGSSSTTTVIGPFEEGEAIGALPHPVLVGGRDYGGLARPGRVTDDGRTVVAQGLRRVDTMGNKSILSSTTEILAVRGLAGFEQGRDIHISIAGGHQPVSFGGPGVTFGGAMTLRSFGGVEPSHWIFRNWDEALVGIVAAGSQTIEYSAIEE